MCDHEEGFDGFDWEEIALAGALVEEMTAEGRERQWLLKQVQPEEDEDSDL
jgi:hypothetical protein